MSLEHDFELDIRNGIRRCHAFGYNPTYWQRMVSDHGALEAAKRLLRGSSASDGFTKLWEEGRLDLSVEFFVVLPRYATLFTPEERAEARRRLLIYDFDLERALRASQRDYQDERREANAEE